MIECWICEMASPSQRGTLYFTLTIERKAVEVPPAGGLEVEVTLCSVCRSAMRHILEQARARRRL